MKKLALTALAIATLSANAIAWDSAALNGLTDMAKGSIGVTLNVPDMIQVYGIEEAITLNTVNSNTQVSKEGGRVYGQVKFGVARNGANADRPVRFTLKVTGSDSIKGADDTFTLKGKADAIPLRVVLTTANNKSVDLVNGVENNNENLKTWQPIGSKEETFRFNLQVQGKNIEKALKGTYSDNLRLMFTAI